MSAAPAAPSAASLPRDQIKSETAEAVDQIHPPKASSPCLQKIDIRAFT
jgi:hypothetical protein